MTVSERFQKGGKVFHLAFAFVLAITKVHADGGWMWQFGEAAVSLGERALSLRHERGGAIPPMWPVSVHSPVVTFRRTVTNAAPAEIEIEADGES